MIDTTPLQFESLARRHQQNSQLWPKRKKLLKPSDPGKFQQELERCMKK